MLFEWDVSTKIKAPCKITDQSKMSNGDLLNVSATYMDPPQGNEIPGVLVHKEILLILCHTGVCGP